MNLKELKYDERGLIPAIVQDVDTREVLMMAWMNQSSIALTIETKKATYWSRGRRKLWVKGETSGHYQTVMNIYYDCDKDTLLLLVKQQGAACHTGERTCFFRELKMEGER